MENETNCKACYGLVNTKAKYCPHCRTPQNRLSAFKQYLPLIIILLIIFFSVTFVKSTNNNEYQPPVSFVDHKDEIIVKSSELSFSDCGDCKKKINTVTIGLIENSSQYGWENFQIEVRFFNTEGKLIDSVSDSIYGLAVQPNSEVSFRVFERAAKPQEEYSSHKVYINDASNISDYY